MSFSVLIPITVVADIGGGAATMGPLFKNIALLGGLVHFAVRGPGAFALDRCGSGDEARRKDFSATEMRREEKHHDGL